jgi:hypothetical protein
MRPILPVRYSGQPQTPVAVSASLSADMSCLLTAAGGIAARDMVQGLAFAAQGGTLVKVAKGGVRGWDVTTTGTDGMQAAVSLTSGYPLSFGLVFVPGTLGTNVNLFNIANSGVVNTRSRLGLRIGTNTVDAYSYGTTGTSAASTSVQAPTVGAINSAVAVFASNASRKVYLNGIAGAAETTGISPAGLTNTCIGSSAATTRQNGQVGQYLLAVFWNRALSDAEALAFTRDPWQVFAPQQRILLTSLATNADGTFASTLANTAGALSGAVLNPGAFASTLAATTSALDGKVTDAGSFATTLAATTAALDGKVTDAGTFASTLAATTGALSGTVLDVGTFASTLANTAASLDGKVTDAGAFSSTLAATTVAATGSVTNAGTFASTLAGAVASLSGVVLNPGTFAATLANTVGALAGTVGNVVTGTFTGLLASLTAALTGNVVPTGTFASTLAATTAALAGTVTGGPVSARRHRLFMGIGIGI